MSYAISAAFQQAVYQRLAGDAVLLELVGSAIHDAPLEVRTEEAASDHITLGDERVRANDSQTSQGAVHDFNVTAHSSRDGFHAVKRIAGAVCDSLIDAPLALARGRVVSLRFLRAKATRGRAPEKRKVSLSFRAILDSNS